MAIDSRNARNIVVEGIHYRWRAAGNDGYISVVICPHELPGAKIVCNFDYHHTMVPDAPAGERATRQLVVTNRIIRRLILHALARGYDPRTRAPEFDLRAADNLIDISDAERGR